MRTTVSGGLEKNERKYKKKTKEEKKEAITLSVNKTPKQNSGINSENGENMNHE